MGYKTTEGTFKQQPSLGAGILFLVYREVERFSKVFGCCRESGCFSKSRFNSIGKNYSIPFSLAAVHRDFWSLLAWQVVSLPLVSAVYMGKNLMLCYMTLHHYVQRDLKWWLAYVSTRPRSTPSPSTAQVS